jgi:hypothetical protein
MESRELLISWWIEKVFHAKAQKSKGAFSILGVFFAPLRLCVKYSLLLVLLAAPCFAQSRMRVADVVKG